MLTRPGPSTARSAAVALAAVLTCAGFAYPEPNGPRSTADPHTDHAARDPDPAAEAVREAQEAVGHLVDPLPATGAPVSGPASRPPAADAPGTPDPLPSPPTADDTATASPADTLPTGEDTSERPSDPGLLPWDGLDGTPATDLLDPGDDATGADSGTDRRHHRAPALLPEHRDGSDPDAPGDTDSAGPDPADTRPAPDPDEPRSEIDPEPASRADDPLPGGGTDAEPSTASVPPPSPDGSDRADTHGRSEAGATDPDGNGAENRAAEADTGADAADAADAVSQAAPEVRFGYDPAVAGAERGGQLVGTLAAWVLAVASCAALGLRLTVGWPRFPPRYRGRRRIGGGSVR